MMLQKFQKHILNRFSFLNDKKILIAISGGIDSVVLTHLFSQLHSKMSLAHCNFQLRNEESNKDEEFVKSLGKTLNIETFTTQFNTLKFSSDNKLSIQVAARELRYQWFDELLVKHQFDYVLTAHHADDNLETFLINLTRGTGLEGLTGIPEINKKTIRPLLIFSSDEILDYAKEHNIEWREDKSNASTKYIRNKIRHQIVPVLKEINPSLLTSFSKTTAHLQESQQIIDDNIENVKTEVLLAKGGVVKMDIDKIQQLSNPKAYLYQLLKEYYFTEWNDIANLLTAQSGKQVFSKTHKLLKNRGFLLLSKVSLAESLSADDRFLIKENTLKITKPICLEFEKSSKDFIKNNQIIYVDKDLLKFPLQVRKWQKGDYFYPAGMQGKKKLSKYFKDEKLSLLEKENIWLLCNDFNEIIWVVGKRQDNRFTITNNTKKRLKITLK